MQIFIAFFASWNCRLNVLVAVLVKVFVFNLTGL